mmetsp:Transcript_30164/g.71830  ORF Transcript_30164/g.71830 Transcript_30164/m.71830 type:complete len:340 (-) Transcript_30164:672-1691(-)
MDVDTLGPRLMADKVVVRDNHPPPADRRLVAAKAVDRDAGAQLHEEEHGHKPRRGHGAALVWALAGGAEADAVAQQQPPRHRHNAARQHEDADVGAVDLQESCELLKDVPVGPAEEQPRPRLQREVLLVHPRCVVRGPKSVQHAEGRLVADEALVRRLIDRRLVCPEDDVMRVDGLAKLCEPQAAAVADNCAAPPGETAGNDLHGLREERDDRWADREVPSEEPLVVAPRHEEVLLAEGSWEPHREPPQPNLARPVGARAKLVQVAGDVPGLGQVRVFSLNFRFLFPAIYFIEFLLLFGCLQILLRRLDSLSHSLTFLSMAVRQRELRARTVCFRIFGR